MAKLTALVSAYYAGDYIERRLNNMMIESGITPEVIVVCKLGSREHAIARAYPGVTTVTTRTVPTIGAAWNIGIKMSSGEYLTTANTDDYWTPDGMERLVNVLDNTSADLAFAMVKRSIHGATDNWDRLSRPSGVIEDPYSLLMDRCIIGPMPVWRRSVHNALGYFNERMTVASDYDMWLRMAAARMKFRYLSDPCGVYVYREESLEHSNQELVVIESDMARSANAHVP